MITKNDKLVKMMLEFDNLPFPELDNSTKNLENSTGELARAILQGGKLLHD